MVQESLFCPVDTKRRRSKEGKSRQEGRLWRSCRGEVGIGWRHYKKEFKLLALLPLAETCGQQTHASLEQVPQHPLHFLSLLSGQASLSAALKCPSVFVCSPGGKVCNPFLKLQVAALFLVQRVPLQFGEMSQREPLHPQLPLFPKSPPRCDTWIRNSAPFTSHFKQRGN